MGVLENANSTGTSLSIYPSPAQDILMVSLAGNEPLTSIELLDALGQQVLSLDQPSRETMQLNIGYLPAGMYSVIARTTTGEMLAKKIQVLR